MAIKSPPPALDWERDSRTGEPCPKCGAEIVYSGNYFCSEWVLAEFYTGRPGSCDWAMEENDEGPLFKRCYRGLMRNREPRSS